MLEATSTTTPAWTWASSITASATVDVYQHCQRPVAEVNVPAGSGLVNRLSIAGSLRNRGIELSLNYGVVRSEELV
jgi:hypothetical protein